MGQYIGNDSLFNNYYNYNYIFLLFFFRSFFCRQSNFRKNTNIDSFVLLFWKLSWFCFFFLNSINLSFKLFNYWFYFFKIYFEKLCCSSKYIGFFVSIFLRFACKKSVSWIIQFQKLKENLSTPLHYSFMKLWFDFWLFWTFLLCKLIIDLHSIQFKFKEKKDIKRYKEEEIYSFFLISWTIFSLFACGCNCLKIASVLFSFIAANRAETNKKSLNLIFFWKKNQ